MEPPAAIASAVAASLALGTSAPMTRSRTGSRWPARSSSDDSPTRAAAAGTVTTRSSGRCSRATSTVMSLVMLAIGRGVSALRAASVRPSTELWTTYACARTGGADAHAAPPNASEASATAATAQRFTRPAAYPPPSPAGRRPDGRLQARGLGRSGAAPVLGGEVAVRVDDGARRVHERAGRPAREGARDVGRRGALRADARQEDDRPRHLAPRLADDPRHGRADDR